MLPTPYYDQGGITIYRGDSRVILPLLVLGEAVLVTDPPYGMAYKSGHRKRGEHERIEGDLTAELRDEILALWGGRPALVFGTWRVARPAGVAQLLIWDKGESPGMGDLAIPWGPGHEEIYVLGGGFAGRRKSNVLRYNTLPASAHDRPDHPTPKPVPLMRDLISYCPRSAVIVDAFIGSGSTLRAAKDLGRRAIGIEVNEKYCQIAVERLRQEVLI